MKIALKKSVALCGLLLATGAALAQSTWPDRPIKVVVTSAPGGLLDVHTRLIAKHMGDKLGQQVVIENRAGAGGLLAFRTVRTAPADGYTLIAAANTFSIQQAAQTEPGYDVAKDFAGIGMMTRSPFVLIAPAGDPDKTLGEFVTRAKGQPGKLTYASSGNGGTTHLAAAMLAKATAMDLTHVPYKGNSAAWPDLAAGRVNLLVEGYATALPMVRDGRVKILGVTSTQRMEALPDVPTLAEAGAPGYSFYLWLGMAAPAGTPKPIIDKLAKALRETFEVPEVKARFKSEGSEMGGMTPTEFDAFLRAESAAMVRLWSELKLPRQ